MAIEIDLYVGFEDESGIIARDIRRHQHAPAPRRVSSVDRRLDSGAGQSKKLAVDDVEVGVGDGLINRSIGRHLLGAGGEIDSRPMIRAFNDGVTDERRGV